MPTNLIGLPVPARIERAAPPRASPSSLVSTTPSNPMEVLNFSAMFTASWPVMASATRSVSCGFTPALIRRSSSMSGSSIWSLPAVSRTTTSYRDFPACSTASRKMELCLCAAEQGHQFFVYDLYYLLAGSKAPQHILANSAFLHPARELLYDLEVHVGFEEHEPYFAERLFDILFLENAPAAQFLEYCL